MAQASCKQMSYCSAVWQHMKEVLFLSYKNGYSLQTVFFFLDAVFPPTIRQSAAPPLACAFSSIEERPY